MVGLERVVDQVRPFHVAGRVEAFDPGQFLRFANAFVGQMDGVLFFLDFEVNVSFAAAERSCRLSQYLVTSSSCRAGDDQRRAGFVDEDVVDFVDDRVVQSALRLLHDAWDSDRRPRAAGFMLSRR